MRDLADKAAFITGGASGIGRGMAEAFAERGVRLVLADIDAAAVEKTAAELAAKGATVHAVQIDVADRAAWDRAAQFAEKAVGPIDILCNNAGVAGIVKPISDVPMAEWRWLMDINFFGLVHGLQCFVPRLKARGQGHIVNTSSIGGVSPTKMYADYIASKFAVVGLSGSVRAELEADNIGVSVLCAGSVKTNLGETTLRQRPARAAYAADRAAMIKDLKWRYIAPLEAGRIVVRGVRENWPFIFTHPEDRALLLARHAEMMRVFDAIEDNAAGGPS